MNRGIVFFDWNTDILHVNAVGPFNAAQIHEVALNYRKVVAHRPTEQFKVIECWDEETLGPPDGLAEIGQTWAWLAQQGCLAIAIVVTNELQKMISEKYLPEVGKVFKDKAAALLWLKKMPKPSASKKG